MAIKLIDILFLLSQHHFITTYLHVSKKIVVNLMRASFILLGIIIPGRSPYYIGFEEMFIDLEQSPKKQDAMIRKTKERTISVIMDRLET